MHSHRAARHGAVFALVVALAAGSGCELLLPLVVGPVDQPPAPSTQPPSTESPDPERTMAPQVEVGDQQVLLTVLRADGWVDLTIEEAGLRLMVPDEWAAAVREDLPDLGGFAGIAASDPARKALQAMLPQMEDGLLVAYLREINASIAPEDVTYVHVTAWRDAGAAAVPNLMGFLVDDRLMPGQWHEIAHLDTPIGQVGRLHYWSQGAGKRYSSLEFVIASPNGEPYTLSFLAPEDRAPAMWNQANSIVHALRPL
jgi:hypothetical protein